ncbi:HpcH/HpaI aldolase/citrate lyase family protein [Citricoccus sp. I39-566]|uniref:HpcH/HpaI aldolase family protein n=1 Tax=Citricoccus sp. I39-566 TaxID=3073268 RepID=UPI00286C087D|nr:HpcH/HpaI aldolase/citrate lyase family protein [Citricoccus sp. I39-566]WMY78656.1 HpcH/HpaI aldolase/citrate lyase family protein [Citricoccus sp. I39-566]
MPIRLEPQPSFKDLFSAQARAGRNGRAPAGMFINSADPSVTEICASAGLDFLLIDGEHAPLGLETIQSQLRAMAGYPVIPVARVPALDPVLVKQYLDLGAQSLVIPMVDSAEDAERAVRAMHYPPRGMRGVGSALARSARWNRVPDYLARAGDLVTLVVQIESAAAVAAAGQIAAVDGVDGIFIGPSDLAASMGLIGQQNHPDVVAAVKTVIGQARQAGRFVGVNAFAPDQARDYLAAGADFVNVGADVALLARATEALADAWCATGTAE